jgi:hypothetical protein
VVQFGGTHGGIGAPPSAKEAVVSTNVNNSAARIIRATFFIQVSPFRLSLPDWERQYVFSETIGPNVRKTRDLVAGSFFNFAGKWF